MKKRFIFILLLLLLVALAANSSQAYAAEVKGAEPLAGFSAYLRGYVDKHGGLYDGEDLRLLSAAMELENGGGSDECLLLTGSVILNRAYFCEWAPDTIAGVLYQPGQYASHTVNNLKTVKVSNRVQDLARQLLIFGPIGPRNMIFQAMFPQGKVYKHVGTEYFGLG